MDELSEKIAKFLNNKNIERKVEDAFRIAIPTVTELKIFISSWTIENYRFEINEFIAKMEKTGVLGIEDVLNFRNIMEDFYLLSQITPGVILLLRGAFLFCIEELEDAKPPENLVSIWEEIFKTVILNISHSPKEWVGQTPKKCIPWNPDFFKYKLKEKRFQSFSLFVENTL